MSFYVHKLEIFKKLQNDCINIFSKLQKGCSVLYAKYITFRFSLVCCMKKTLSITKKLFVVVLFFFFSFLQLCRWQWSGFRQTFSTKSLPGTNFFKPSVPGDLRVFWAFCELVHFCSSAGDSGQASDRSQGRGVTKVKRLLATGKTSLVQTSPPIQNLRWEKEKLFNSAGGLFGDLFLGPIFAWVAMISEMWTI